MPAINEEVTQVGVDINALSLSKLLWVRDRLRTSVEQQRRRVNRTQDRLDSVILEITQLEGSQR